MQEILTLLKPDMSWSEEIAAYRREMLEAGSSMDGTGTLRRREDVREWLRDVEMMDNPETVPAHLVRGTQYIYVREADRRIVGMIDLRHELNNYLYHFGGHIGYSVRPSERRRGYASRMLAELLNVCRRAGLGRVLVTCLQENEASRRVILKNGGIYENTVLDSDSGERLERYWISL